MLLDITEQILHIVGEENLKIKAPMSEYTSFKAGGLADYLVTPRNQKEIKKIIEVCKNNDISFYVMGKGSNLLVKDEGYSGVIIQIFKNMSNCSIKGKEARVEAGICLKDLSEILCENSLTGMEFASGIPGTLGGAVSMNAGAYDGEMKDVVISATIMDSEGNIKKYSVDELEMGYRTTLITKNNYILLEAVLKLENGVKEEIEEKIEDLNNRRKEKQPLEFPSAGSTFKRPKGYFAGKLIMDAGLAGHKVGGAMVSEKHCGFVINSGNATASDIIRLIEEVVEKVYEKFGVELEPEVKIL